MKRNILIILSVILIGGCAKTRPGRYLITDFGAKPGENNINTEAITKAVNACAENGGGTVVIPAGTFYSGTIILKSNVELLLDHGSVLAGSGNMADYDTINAVGGLIYANNARNISITGTGTIFGNGTHFHIAGKMHIAGDLQRKYIRQGESYLREGATFADGPIDYEHRPGMMIVFVNSENVHISDITIKDSPNWTFRIADCDNVNVRNITILNNLLIPNNDGIHCTDSRNIVISDCDIRAGDDAIIVSGFAPEINVHGEAGERKVSQEYGNKTGYAENVTVTNCVLQSRSSGIRVGPGTHSIRNLVFSNIVIYDSNRGIGVFERDTASIRNVLFSGIIIRNRLHSGHWWGNGEPIHVSSIARSKDITSGQIRNIRFSNVIANSETGVLLWGGYQSALKDIIFDRVQLHIRNSPLAATYGGNFDLRPSPDLKYAIFKHDIPGFFARNVDNLKIEEFNLTWDSDVADYHSYGFEGENIIGLDIDSQSSFPAAPGSGKKDISLINVTK
jgi:polygalacturonase